MIPEKQDHEYKKISVDLKNAKKHLSKHEFQDLKDVFERIKKDQEIDDDELKYITQLIMKIQLEAQYKGIRMIKNLLIAFISLVSIVLVLMVLGFWNERFFIAGSHLAITINFIVTIYMLKARNKHFKKLPLSLRIGWNIAFFLNMYFFVDGILGIFNIKISF